MYKLNVWDWHWAQIPYEQIPEVKPLSICVIAMNLNIYIKYPQTSKKIENSYNDLHSVLKYISTYVYYL